ncbi:hypothetical protein [Pseudomarimonas salicorniae]|uniref:Isoquinoline 1-oxidoreductase subunit n=1 Tax=Pseudomarimonas salicorniae TaxID=2933270 RepID=A0ABT0GE80_9GAMM|nr:hypothetical protein [Lysobacter sp. CAU 1642]MCK7592305.1 hypothetical protein [Lysobacter sp. CAU 1642]
MSALRWTAAILGFAVVASATAGGPSAATLKPLSEFEAIGDRTQRAHALFAEIGRVIQHPRCVNCHPRTDRPLQGDDGALHQPLVVRGLGGMGRPGMLCNTCHLAENFGNVPGNPKWHLAPASMAWEDVPLAGICEQIKDPQRNGGKSLEALGKHMAEDELVGYGWNPPAHLQPVPGDQQQFGQLFQAWLDAGAHCPPR